MHTNRPSHSDATSTHDTVHRHATVAVPALGPRPARRWSGAIRRVALAGTFALLAAAATACTAGGGAAPMDSVRDDEAEISRLVTRLGVALDEHDFQALPQLFTPEATATTPGGTAVGRDKVIAQATRNHTDFPNLQHIVSGVLVDVSGDRAEVRANLVGYFGRADDPEPVRRIGGVYRFGAVRTEDGWRFDALTVRQVWRIERETAA
ncbi:nuclear transport factor 2 family protein [Nocardia otitidiscaviarum]|uniref:nuclear transport factor 2 family protein n=1 Tax=Nocardia otitidiscaviarum TaxID=1823 RepID=UPI001893EDB2|nr:nuclear transport factor 2 family protein [Nocardia otitidiscaviarum]MBF6238797.1 nuclear transport factor 2 family protein [Nocardia otitidiscaviarum]